MLVWRRGHQLDQAIHNPSPPHCPGGVHSPWNGLRRQEQPQGAHQEGRQYNRYWEAQRLLAGHHHGVVLLGAPREHAPFQDATTWKNLQLKPRLRCHCSCQWPWCHRPAWWCWSPERIGEWLNLAWGHVAAKLRQRRPPLGGYLSWFTWSNQVRWQEAARMSRAVWDMEGNSWDRGVHPGSEKCPGAVSHTRALHQADPARRYRPYQGTGGVRWVQEAHGEVCAVPVLQWLKEVCKLMLNLKFEH